MSRTLNAARSILSLVLVMLWFMVGAIALYPFVLPAGALLRPWRRRIVSVYMKVICWGSRIRLCAWAADASATANTALRGIQIHRPRRANRWRLDAGLTQAQR